MKNVSVFLVLFCAVALAQNSPQPETSAPAQPSQANQAAPMHFPAGTLIPAQLQKTVDARKAKSGDKVEAVVASDLQSKSGEIVIARGTKILGHVTEVKAKSKEDPGSTLGIAFETMSMKDGKQVPFDAEIQALRRNTPQAAPAAAAGDSPDYQGSGMPAGAGSGSRAASRGESSPSSSYPGASPAAGADNSGSSQTASNAAPQLTATSQGPVGFEDMSMQQSADGTTLRAQKQNVKLESGTQMILKVRK